MYKNKHKFHEIKRILEKATLNYRTIFKSMLIDRSFLVLRYTGRSTLDCTYF